MDAKKIALSDEHAPMSKDVGAHSPNVYHEPVIKVLFTKPEDSPKAPAKPVMQLQGIENTIPSQLGYDCVPYPPGCVENTVPPQLGHNHVLYPSSWFVPPGLTSMDIPALHSSVHMEIGVYFLKWIPPVQVPQLCLLVLRGKTDHLSICPHSSRCMDNNLCTLMLSFPGTFLELEPWKVGKPLRARLPAVTWSRYLWWQSVGRLRCTTCFSSCVSLVS